MLSVFRSSKKKDKIDIANDMADDNLSTANHILGVALETQSVGADTLVKLDEQEDQIDHINDGLAEIEINAKEGSKHISGIRSIPGAILHSFAKHCCCCLSTPEESLEKEKKKNRKIGHKKHGSNQTNLPVPSGATLSTWDRPDRPLSEKERHFAETTQKTHAVVGQVDQVVDVLHQQATDMGETLDRHNEKLDRANERAHNGTQKIKKNRSKLR